MSKPPLGEVVLVDMDGVLADFDQEVTNRLMARYPHIPIVEKQTTFRVSGGYPEHAELVEELSDEEGFFSSLPLVDGALDGWQRIINAGFLPRICSSPKDTHPNCEEEKLCWLKEKFVPIFGSWVVEQAMITSNKEDCEGIALIDDKSEIDNANEALWRHIIFDRPHNAHSKKPRLYGWYDENLPSLLESARLRAQ